MNLKCIFVFLFAKERKIYTVFIDRPGFLKIKVISFPFRCSLLSAFFVKVELGCFEDLRASNSRGNPSYRKCRDRSIPFLLCKNQSGHIAYASYVRMPDVFSMRKYKQRSHYNMLETGVFIPNSSTPFKRPLRYLIHPNKRLKLSCKMDHLLQREDV